MTPHLKSVFGITFTIYSCFCEYSEDTCGCKYDNKTTYTGGGANDRTVIKQESM